MHEWALAEAVVSAASEVVEKSGMKKVASINIGLGELQQVDLEIFKFALSQLLSGRLKDAKIKIRKTRARLKCRVCGCRWLFSKTGLDKSSREAIHFVPEIAHAFVRCPECNSPDFEVEQGRGVWIENIVGKKRCD
ncbi:hydrogenase nickel incorporation protein HypA [Candidatus Bathyarchaeota archaeon]|nr:hydrogenase nickel incorporation protein HypA [Candidatus Bathyarchaeota archaeon]